MEVHEQHLHMCSAVILLVARFGIIKFRVQGSGFI
jgi:hypothetical protein